MSTAVALDPTAAIVAASRELLDNIRQLVGRADVADIPASVLDDLAEARDGLTKVLSRARAAARKRIATTEPTPAAAVPAADKPAVPAAAPAASPATNVVTAALPARVTVPVRREPMPQKSGHVPATATTRPIRTVRVRSDQVAPSRHGKHRAAAARRDFGGILGRSLLRWGIAGFLLLCLALAAGSGVSITDISTVLTIVASVTLAATLGGLARASYRRGRAYLRARRQ